MHKLNFDIPLTPSIENIMQAVSITDGITKEFSVNGTVKLCENKIDDSAHRIVQVMDALFVSCYASASPFLPLIACEIVKYSFQQKAVPLESALSFGTLGMFLIFLKGDYTGGKKWAEVVRGITDFHTHKSKTKHYFDGRANLLPFLAIDIWFKHPIDLSSRIYSYHQKSLKMGQWDIGMISLHQSWRYKIFGGENLSLILKSTGDMLELIVRERTF